jgi:putative flippase GtrA
MTNAARMAFLRFVGVGVVNTMVGLATVLASSEWLGANAFVANGAGLLAGFIIGYQLNRLWTFRSSHAVVMTAPRYLLAFALSYSVNLAILAFALRAGLHPLLAQGAALAVYSLAFFFLCRIIVFPAEEQ